MSNLKKSENQHSLFKGARLRIFRHDIVQRLHTDVDDAAEFVLDHAESTHRVLYDKEGDEFIT